MDETKCLTPANSLTSLEKAKLCNTLMHKIKSTESRKIIFRNPAEPTDYDKSVSAVYPDTIINLEDKFRNNRQYEEELSNENGQEYATYFELDVNKLTSNLQFVEHKVEDDFADISSVDGNTIKNYIEEDLSDDEVSIIRAKEVIAHYKSYKTKMKNSTRKENEQESIININQRKEQDLQSYLYYSMLLFLLCTFCLILVFL